MVISKLSLVFLLIGLVCENTVKCATGAGVSCSMTLDIIIILDSSGSVTAPNWPREVEFAKRLVKQIKVSQKDIHVGVIDFSKISIVRVDMNKPEGYTPDSIQHALDNLKSQYQKGGTNMDFALASAVQMYNDVPPDRYAPKLLLIVTDGKATGRNHQTGVELMRDEIESLKLLNVNRIAIGVGMGVRRSELDLVASYRGNVILESTFQALLNDINKIVKVLCKPACSVTFNKIGCFKDNMHPRPLPELILNDRDPTTNSFSGRYIDWKNSQTYMPDFICRCAKKAISMGIPQRTVFGIQNFGECWASSKATTYDKDGVGDLDGCKTAYYKRCDANSAFCVGAAHHNFVYKIVV